MGSSPHHVVMFPFMAEGHTLPLIDLSKALSHRQIKVSFLTTPHNAKHICQLISGYSLIHLIEIPFPTIEGLPEGCENTSQLPSLEFYIPFLLATRQLQEPFEQFMQNLSESRDLPICVISDFFLGWTHSTCQEYNVPRLVFHGMSVLSMTICKLTSGCKTQLGSLSESEAIDLPIVKLPFTLTKADLPVVADDIPVNGDDGVFFKIVSEFVEYEVNSWGVVVNSFQELEGSYVSSLESFYNKDAKAWCLGPFFLYNQMEKQDINISKNQETIASWLDEQSPASVIYVAFGTQADVSDTQLNEVAYGLEASDVPFVLVVRSKSWAPPNGMQERLSKKALIIQEFVNQRSILSHKSVGGFLSHCGWNSVLESVAAGKPILAWPLIPFSEQSLNAKFVVDGIKVGLALKRNAGDIVEVTREAACEGVKELMCGEGGMKAGKNAEVLGMMARKAVRDGGSSSEALIEMIHRLCI